MKVFKVLGTGIILLILLWLVISVFLPSTVHIERTDKINARQEIIFKQLNDPGTWKIWLKPSLIQGEVVTERDGPLKGPGAVIKWESPNDTAESGMISIAATEEPGKVLFTVEPEDGSVLEGGWQLDTTENINVTNTTLYMDFHVGFFGRVFPGLMLDGWAGPVFEKVLVELAAFCEPIVPEFKPKYNYEDLITRESHNLTVIRDCKPSEISMVLGECYDIISNESKRQDLQITGPPFCIFHHYDEDSVNLEAGLPVDKPAVKSGKVNALTLPSQRAVRVDYYGDYDNLSDVYRFMRGLTARKIFTSNGSPWESYVTDPGTEPDTSKWYTQIYFPVK